MNDRSPASLFLAIASLSLVGLFAGCASYQLGSSATLPYQKVFVEPVTNDSYAPQAQAVVSAKIRDVLIRDGRVQLVTSEEAADAVLSVNLTEYKRTGNTRDTSDTGRAQDFTVTLSAEVSFFDQANGSYYFQKRRIVETTNAYRDDPYTRNEDTGLGTQSYFGAEYQAMPLLAHGMARQVADTILSNW